MISNHGNGFKVAFFICVLFAASAKPSASEAICSDLSPEVAESVYRRVCNEAKVDISDLLRTLGVSGNDSSDIDFVLRLLNSFDQPDTIKSPYTDEGRLLEILMDNSGIRNGLRAILLRSKFLDSQIAEWCQWRRDGLEKDKTPIVQMVENSVACGPP